MPPRARPMSADDRRLALIEATVPLLRAHGRGVTTKQVAEAAGVAEGTIFRVFDSKDDLVQAALEQAFSFEPFIDALHAIDPDRDVRVVAADLVEVLQARFAGIFGLMTAVGMVGPPKARHHHEDERRRSAEAMTALLQPHASRFSVPVEHVVHTLRLLTFSGTHPHVSDGRLLSTDQIVGCVLDGLLKED